MSSAFLSHSVAALTDAMALFMMVSLGLRKRRLVVRSQTCPSCGRKRAGNHCDCTARRER